MTPIAVSDCVPGRFSSGSGSSNHVYLSTLIPLGVPNVSITSPLSHLSFNVVRPAFPNALTGRFALTGLLSQQAFLILTGLSCLDRSFPAKQLPLSGDGTDNTNAQLKITATKPLPSPLSSELSRDEEVN